MTILVRGDWQQVGTLEDGTPVRAVAVMDDERMVGRVLDMTDGFFVASFVNVSGDVEEIVVGDYFTAVMRVAEEASLRKRVLH